MAEWLSAEWVGTSAEALGSWLDGTAGASTGVQPPAVAVTVTVTGGPDGDARYQRHWRPAPEATSRARLAPEATSAEPREVALALAAPDARAILAGDLSPSVAFMRGRMKTSGDPGAVLDLLAATADERFTEALRRVRDATDL